MIVALAGRRIDELNAGYTRFPLRNIHLVRERLKHKLVSINCTSLVCAGACGSDLLALEVAGEVGISRTMILPFNHSLFRKESVVDRPGKWGSVFDNIYKELKDSGSVKEFDYSLDDLETYNKTNMKILQQAKQFSKNPNDITAVIMWEGKSRGLGDVTENFYEQAKMLNFNILEIITSK